MNKYSLVPIIESNWPQAACTSVYIQQLHLMHHYLLYWMVWVMIQMMIQVMVQVACGNLCLRYLALCIECNYK